MPAMSIISVAIQSKLNSSNADVVVKSPHAPGWIWEVVKYVDGDSFICRVMSPAKPLGEWCKVDFKGLVQEIDLMTV